jgi:hypothetical protein
VRDSSRWILNPRLGFKIPETESYSTNPRSTARANRGWDLIPTAGADPTARRPPSPPPPGPEPGGAQVLPRRRTSPAIQTAAPNGTTTSPSASTLCGEYGEQRGGLLPGSRVAAGSVRGAERRCEGVLAPSTDSRFTDHPRPQLSGCTRSVDGTEPPSPDTEDQR